MVRTYEVKDGIEKDNLIRQPFTRKYTDDEREDDSGERLNIRINADDRIIIDNLKQVLTFGSDASVIKMALIVFQNVINNTLSNDLMKRISTRDRVRPTPKELKDK